MTRYEILSICASLIAILVALISLVRTRKLSAQQLELEKVTANLSKKQLEQIESEEHFKSKGHIDVALEGHGSNYRFVITNNGGAEAKNIHFHFEGEGNPLVMDEYERKIPIPSLKPGKTVTLIATLGYGIPRQYKTYVRWINPDGTQGKDDYFVSA